jgi:tetratricopeptide (TPR) repeat protein
MESEARRLCDLGKEFLDRGEPEEALRCYERAIDVDPDNPDAWCGRGKASYDLGRLERADRDFRRALRLARGELADAKTGKPGVRRWWSDAKTRPYLKALHGHGLCRFWLGSYEDAARIFRRLLKLAPTDPLDVRFLVGETYLRMGRIERAVRELARAEDDPDALYNLGLALFYAGDFPGSVNAFRRGIFANLYLPALVCERPQREDLGGKGGDDDGDRDDDRDDDKDDAPAHPTDAGAHPKGLDSEDAASDYVDRCGDLWFGRPVLQRWLDGIRNHPTVAGDVERHLAHLKALAGGTLSAGDRARIEGENTTLRSGDRRDATDRKVAADVLAAVFALPPEKKPGKA